jgi:hypothetical protein
MAGRGLVHALLVKNGVFLKDYLLIEDTTINYKTSSPGFSGNEKRDLDLFYYIYYADNEFVEIVNFNANSTVSTEVYDEGYRF